MTTTLFRERRFVRIATVGSALLLGSLAGLAGGPAAADVLVPVEDVGAPGGGGGIAVVDTEFSPSQNQQSIARIESTQTEDGALDGAPDNEIAGVPQRGDAF